MSGLGKLLGDLDESFSEIALNNSTNSTPTKKSTNCPHSTDSNVNKEYTSCIKINGRPILPPIMNQVRDFTSYKLL